MRVEVEIGVKDEKDPGVAWEGKCECPGKLCIRYPLVGVRGAEETAGTISLDMCQEDSGPKAYLAHIEYR
jgi:hypothetical protein